jgi:steroid delta-isomerase-like uncharacterized protein
MSEENKTLTRRMMMDVWQDGKLEKVDEYYSENFISHNETPGIPQNREGLKMYAGMLRAAFSAGKISVDDQISEGDTVVTRWSSTSTHSGDFMGIPASGKEVAVTGISISRFDDGKIAEEWGEADMVGLMQQVGAMPDSG